MLNVLAVYDICRSNLANFKGLSRGEDERPLDSGNCINYQSISGTDPRGTVPAASKLAVLLFKECDLAAAQNAHSEIHVPIAWISFQGENGMVEKGTMGETYWLKWRQNTVESMFEDSNANTMAEDVYDDILGDIGLGSLVGKEEVKAEAVELDDDLEARLAALKMS